MAPLIVICGQTATGKSALALKLAERYHGELICADSRTVYRGMDIGTAKPTPEERAQIPHWGLDLVSLDERFTVADFKVYADDVIEDIAARGKLPIIVGGTGLYIDAVIYDYQFRDMESPGLRRDLQGQTVEELQGRIRSMGLELPENARNPRHLIRIIETGGAVAHRSDLRPGTIIIGLQTNTDELQERIKNRVEQMIENGLVDEVRQLGAKFGWDAAGLQAPGYRAMREYLESIKTLDEAKAQFVKNDLDLAKRQRTWFKRNNSIHWLNHKHSDREKLAEAVALVTTVLNK